MLTGQRAGADMLSATLSLGIGLLLIGTGATTGNVRNLILGGAFAVQGAIGILIPRLLPPAPGLGPERARARRVAVVIIPSGIVFIVAGVLLLALIPAERRDSLTVAIAVGLLLLGGVNVLSGLGARRRATRIEPVAETNLREHTPE